jgi:hypothetical protein
MGGSGKTIERRTLQLTIDFPICIEQLPAIVQRRLHRAARQLFSGLTAVRECNAGEYHRKRDTVELLPFGGSFAPDS